MYYHDIVAVYSVPGYALCIMMINFFNNVMSFFFFFLFGPSFLWQRNVVEVEWMETHNKNIYRVGLKGKVRGLTVRSKHKDLKVYGHYVHPNLLVLYRHFQILCCHCQLSSSDYNIIAQFALVYFAAGYTFRPPNVTVVCHVVVLM